MARFPQGCSDKHGREMKIKDLTLLKKATSLQASMIGSIRMEI